MAARRLREWLVAATTVVREGAAAGVVASRYAGVLDGIRQTLDIFTLQSTPTRNELLHLAWLVNVETNLALECVFLAYTYIKSLDETDYLETTMVLDGLERLRAAEAHRRLAAPVTHLIR